MAALASQPTTAAVAPTGAACFKCGKRGHWSRDCVASKEDQDAHRAAKEAAEAALAAGLPAGCVSVFFSRGIERGESGLFFFETRGSWTLALDPHPFRSPHPTPLLHSPPPAKRSRKVTLDDLKAPDGLPELYATLPSRFRRLASGRRGEEGPDLARLVDLYAAWGRRLAPALAFPALLDSLEALGRTGAVKLELRDLRAQALAPLERVGRPEGGDEGEDGPGLVGGWLGAGPVGPTAPAPAPPAFATGGGDEDDDDAAAAAAFDDAGDDELLELQAAVAAPAAPAPPPPAASVAAAGAGAARAPEQEEADEDALVALFEDGSQEEEAEEKSAGVGPGAGAPPPAGEGAGAAPPPPPPSQLPATAEEEDALVALFASQVEAE